MIKATDIRPTLIRTTAELVQAVASWRHEVPVVADVETYLLTPKDGKLLGVALCSVERPTEPVYVVLQWFDFNKSTWHINPEFDTLINCLPGDNLVGHNYAYDKSWLDHVTNTWTQWHADTRLMWHMASAPAGPRPYGLKDAQVEVLGWDKRGDAELVEQVKARGGKIKDGGHYLADVEVIGRYACLDAASTALLYNEAAKFFNEHDYWWMLEKMVEYSWLLQECTDSGIAVDVEALEKQIEMLIHTKEAYSARFIELVAPHIQRLERNWREHRAAKYTNAPAREKFLASWNLQKKFKLSSDKDKRELFYEAMQLPVVLETDGGKPSTGVEAVQASIRASKREDLKDVQEAYEQAESAETLLNSFAKPWLGAVRGGRLHPRFNPCGTVSYRLSGFKPYLLNAPFDEKELMSCLRCDEGWEGVHADFTSIEPAVTAHYSQDPHLLKVFRDGKGDVYLDLALTLFPQDTSLREGYDPTGTVTAAIKDAFKRQRKIAKIIQLAVQYTGTKYTVAKNLSMAGVPTTLAQADALVKAYWQHFDAVRRMNEAIFRRYRSQGCIRNVVGRVIRVPNPGYKDLPNRFIQSSAHDLLSSWILRISRLVQARGITAKAVILDCHDSTTWQAPKEQVQALEQVFRDALDELNAEVRMTVPVRMEMKRFTTLAGLKGEE